MTIERKKKAHRHYPFRRKFEETPYEVLKRLDKKLRVARAELPHWRVKISDYAIHVADSIRTEIGLLKQERERLLDEMNQRRQEFLTVFPNVNIVEWPQRKRRTRKL